MTYYDVQVSFNRSYYYRVDRSIKIYDGLVEYIDMEKKETWIWSSAMRHRIALLAPFDSYVTELELTDEC